jgi:hypothetical protein
LIGIPDILFSEARISLMDQAKKLSEMRTSLK